MEATRIFAQRRDNAWADGGVFGWYTIGALLLLACMAVCAALVILSAPVPTDAETVRVMVGR